MTLILKIKPKESKLSSLAKTFLGKKVASGSINPEEFDDEVGSKTEWKVLSYFTAGYRTHKIYLNDEFCISLIPTISSLVLTGIGLLWGIAITAYVYAYNIDFEYMFFGVFFVIISVISAYYLLIPIKFDKNKGVFQKGPQSISLKKIFAIQLLSKKMNDSDGSDYVYQLNLVLNNAERKMVLTHKWAYGLREDAETISKFLKVPVWDAI